MSVAETQEENSSDMSLPSTSEEVGSQDDQSTLIHPCPYLEEFFEMVGCKNNSFRMRCKLCAPKYHKNSPSNLKKHIEVSCNFVIISRLLTNLKFDFSQILSELILLLYAICKLIVQSYNFCYYQSIIDNIDLVTY